MSARVLAVAEELCREIESFDPALYSGADRALLAEALARTEKACGGARPGPPPGRGPAGRTRTGALPTGPTGWPRARAAPGAKPGRAGHGQVFRRPAGHGRGAGQRPGAPERGGRGGPGRGRTPGQRKRTGGPGPGPGPGGPTRRSAQTGPGGPAGRGPGPAPAPRPVLPPLARRAGPGALFRRPAAYHRYRPGQPHRGRGVPLTQGGRAGRPGESFDACAADALVHMLAGQGKGPSPRADVVVVVVVDLAAYRRGHAHTGETGHIVGGGPVTVGFAHQTAEDAFIKAVTHDGVRIEHGGPLRPPHPGRAAHRPRARAPSGL